MDQILTQLEQRGYAVVDNFLSAHDIHRLFDAMQGSWQPAAIGREGLKQTRTDIRRDKTLWLQPDMGQGVNDYLARMEALRQQVNRHFFLGLFEYEAHFAYYPPGGFYKKHLDAFVGRSNRRLTTVLYLNGLWQADWGGELVMYDDQDQVLESITPVAGRLVCFFSERFPHEVLPCRHERYSIAGWFRVNGVGQTLDIAR